MAFHPNSQELSELTLPLCFLDYFDRVIDKDGKVSDTVIDIRRLVHSDERFVEDQEQVFEKFEGNRL